MQAEEDGMRCGTCVKQCDGDVKPQHKYKMRRGSSSKHDHLYSLSAVAMPLRLMAVQLALQCLPDNRTPFGNGKRSYKLRIIVTDTFKFRKVLTKTIEVLSYHVFK